MRGTPIRLTRRQVDKLTKSWSIRILNTARKLLVRLRVEPVAACEGARRRVIGLNAIGTP